jgi:hypothetical protein
MRKSICALFLIIGMLACADKMASTDDGNRVILHDNGTWAYVGENTNNRNTTNFSDPISVVQGYLSAVEWQGRLPYVGKAAEVKPLMQERYGDFVGPTKYMEIMPRQATTDRESEAVQVDVRFDENDTSSYILIKSKDGYRIDWESSVGYNPMAWAEFKASTPKKATRFRAYAQLTDDYPAAFEVQGVAGNYWAFEISDYAGNYIALHGYIPRKVDDGNRLYQLAKDGKYHKVMLDLAYEDIPFGKGYVLIVKYVTEGWYIE